MYLCYMCAPLCWNNACAVHPICRSPEMGLKMVLNSEFWWLECCKNWHQCLQGNCVHTTYMHLYASSKYMFFINSCLIPSFIKTPYISQRPRSGEITKIPHEKILFQWHVPMTGPIASETLHLWAQGTRQATLMRSEGSWDPFSNAKLVNSVILGSLAAKMHPSPDGRSMFFWVKESRPLSHQRKPCTREVYEWLLILPATVPWPKPCPCWPRLCLCPQKKGTGSPEAWHGFVNQAFMISNHFPPQNKNVQ